MMKKPKFSRSILPLTAALLALGIGAGNPALAQGDEQLEEVVVTGSRIVRRDFESNSPILTVGEELLEQTFTSSLDRKQP